MNTLNIIGHITGVEIQKSGTIIEFISNESISVKRKLSINHEDKDHYFEVVSVETSIEDRELFVKAKEVGYWCNNFDNKSNIDIRDLLGLEINIVTDNDTLRKIEKESCYC